MGIFGDLFDFNSDGKMDAWEQAAEFGMFMQMLEEEKNEELLSAGIDPDCFDDMEYYEQVEALEDAGLDPADFDL